jgi:hypothetical protein
MIVQHQADNLMLGIGLIQLCQKLYKVLAGVALTHQFRDLPGVEINASQQREGSMPDVLVVAQQGGMLASYSRFLGLTFPIA